MDLVSGKEPCSIFSKNCLINVIGLSSGIVPMNSILFWTKDVLNSRKILSMGKGMLQNALDNRVLKTNRPMILFIWEKKSDKNLSERYSQK